MRLVADEHQPGVPDHGAAAPGDQVQARAIADLIQLVVEHPCAPRLRVGGALDGERLIDVSMTHRLDDDTPGARPVQQATQHVHEPAAGGPWLARRVQLIWASGWRR